jgi:hypothetical protein
MIRKPKKMVLHKEDCLSMLHDILTLQVMFKKIWGNEIYMPDDFGMSVYSWQWHLSQVVTAKTGAETKKKLKAHLKDAVEIK